MRRVAVYLETHWARRERFPPAYSTGDITVDLYLLTNNVSSLVSCIRRCLL